MVDEVAKEKGYNIKAYHGSKNKFTVFDKNRIGQGNDQYGSGFYFASDSESAQYYGNVNYSSYLKLNNSIELNGEHSEYDRRESGQSFNIDNESSGVRYQARPDFDDFLFDDFDGEVTDNDARLMTECLRQGKTDIISSYCILIYKKGYHSGILFFI